MVEATDQSMKSRTQSTVANPATQALHARPFWPRDLVLGLLPLLIGFEVMVWIVSLPPALRGSGDFTTLYATGYMLRTHHGVEIYDDEKLLEFKNTVTPGKFSLMPMDHLAYEALIFAPLSFLPYRAALVTFIIVNLAVLVLCSRLLRRPFRVLHERWKPFPILLFAAFFPITRTLLQGQDSIILLALLVGAWIYLEAGKEGIAGILTALGLFKLQIVIPIAVMFFLWRRWRFVIGFAMSSTLMLGLTLLVVGIQGIRLYASMLLNISFRLRTETDAMRYLLSPKTMLNIRGLASGILLEHLPHWWIQGIIVAVSLIVLIIAARHQASMPVAIVAAALVSYHLNAQDASILMIPLGLALCGDSKWRAAIGVLVLITPIIAVAPLLAYWAAVPILLLFVAMVCGRDLSNDALPSPTSS